MKFSIEARCGMIRIYKRVALGKVIPNPSVISIVPSIDVVMLNLWSNLVNVRCSSC
jgi:hypothetical protein